MKTSTRLLVCALLGAASFLPAFAQATPQSGGGAVTAAAASDPSDGTVIPLGVYSVTSTVDGLRPQTLGEAGRGVAAPAPIVRPRQHWRLAAAPMSFSDGVFEPGRRDFAFSGDSVLNHSNIDPLNTGRELTTLSLVRRF